MQPTADAFLSAHLTPPFQLNPLRSGAVNTAWRVESNGQRYFLKYQGDAQHTGVDRVQEVRLQRALYLAHLTPRVIAYSRDYSWVLQEWVDAPTATSLGAAEQSRLLADTLWRIHQQRPPLPRWSLKHRVANYVSAVGRYDSQQAQQFAQALDAYQSLLAEWDSAPAVLCHNDLSSDHVLLSTPARVVDWEYAGFGHAWFDLASCIEINQLDDTSQARLCRQYSAASGAKVSPTDLAPWRGLMQVVNQLWYHAQHLQRD